MTTVTFGSGGDYPTAGAALVPYSGGGYHPNVDLTLIQVGDAHETSTLQLGAPVGVQFNIISDTPHNGDPNAGHLWDLSGCVSGGYFFLPGNVTLKGLRIAGNAGSNPLTSLLFIADIAVNYEIVVDGCLIDYAGYGNGIGFTGNAASAIIHILRNECWISSGSVTPSLHCDVNSYSQYTVIENNTFRNNVSWDGPASVYAILRNNYASSFGIGGSILAIGYNNKSVSAMPTWYSGSSGNSGGIVAANEFASQVDTDPNFLFLKQGNTLFSAGTAPTLISSDIAELPIPNVIGNYYTVGAHSYIPFAANFSADITNGPTNLTVNFTDTSVGSPTFWLYNFGDGYTSSAQSPTHIYKSAGTYTVSLSASTSAFSDMITMTNYITVSTKCDLKENYISIAGPIQVARYGENRLINLTNFLPQYIAQTDTFTFVKIFENYLNNIFDGQSGFILSATDIPINKNYATSAT